MNNKYWLLSLLFLAGAIEKIQASETFAMEMTFPPSALLIVCPNLTEAQENYNRLGPNNAYTYYSQPAGWACAPQVDGYFAITGSAWIILQRGGFWGAFENYSYSNYVTPLVYFSDFVRAFRGYTKGPKSAHNRGGWNAGNSTFSQYFTYTAKHNGNWFKYDIFKPMKDSLLAGKNTGVWNYTQGTKELTYSSFTPVNSNPCSYYFAQTGYGVFLALHMISPGANLLAVDPAYVNYGPTIPNTPATKPQSPNFNPAQQKEIANIVADEWMQWGYSYCPPSIDIVAKIPGVVNELFEGLVC